MSAINRYKRYHKPHKSGNIDERSNGNGSLMRIMPAVLYCIDNALSSEDAIDIIHKAGGLTHAHIRSNIACGLYYFMAAAVLNGDDNLTDRLQAGLDKGFAFYEKQLDTTSQTVLRDPCTGAPVLLIPPRADHRAPRRRASWAVDRPG